MRKLGLLALAALLITGAVAQETKQLISLEDIHRNGTFAARSVRGIVSMNDGEHYTVMERGGKVSKYSYAKGELVEVLFDASAFDNPALKQFAGYQLSADETKMLITTDVNSIYRHSFTASYYIYDIASKSLTPLSDNGAQMLATFSPNGQNVAFVRDNNIFIKNLPSNTEKQITFDGEFNHIINGAADWVYEEEFALTTGIQWSPDSRRLAYNRFDESNVKVFHMPMFQNQLYPPNYSFKYPKAGEENSLVSIHVYELESESMKTMDIGPETDQYIARIKWTTNPEQLSMIRLNRLQNKLEILLADAKTGQSSVLYTEENRYYIEEPNDDYPYFTEDGKHFIITSEQDGYSHIYLYGMNGQLVRQLTKGQNEVRSIYGYDAKGKRIYFNHFDGTPMRTSVSWVSVDGKKQGKVSTLPGTNSADFSNGFKYYIHFHSSVNTPTLVTLHNAKGKELRVLEDNAKLKETIAKYQIPQKEFFTFKTSEGVELNGYMVKPLNFDETKKYPVLMYQYSGPGSVTVTDRFGIGWDQLLATEGYMVVAVDGRGTGGRGEEFKKMTYGQLGYYESIDQIEAGKYLQTLPYVDAKRIGIWGWSYGGYMSSLCLFKAPQVFSMAIAVAPVTNWRYYDTIYTERFMGLPQNNPNGYDDNSPINHVDGLQGKLLLVHGTGDDNVHVQNAVELAEKLIQAEKQFDMMLYPDKNHGIYGGNTRMHLYTLMTNYIKANL
ncbi:MAG: S9 family peptidase [Tenuifilaceae bacterium]|jgi:dipeptidyl-peptidase-4|nr:S9 family peptidase [Tenuifilaceae bacterium]